MTEYPVQCFEHNGEPYGRYCNPVEVNSEIDLHNWKDFETFSKEYTFPMPSGTIGKTYEMDEVEVASQAWEFDWVDATLTIDQYKSISFDTRQIFRLIPQPVEKEPVSMKKVKCDKCYGSGFYSSKYGQAACEKCNNGYVFKEVRKRKTKAKRAVEKEPEIAHNELYFDIAEIAQDNIIIQDPEKFKEDRLKQPWNEKAKKKYHDQVQFDALQFMRDLKKKGYKITKDND